MIAYLQGLVLEKSENEVIVNCNGVGYLVFCSSTTIASLPRINEECKLYIKTIVREDALDLFGFSTHDEKMLFNLLTSISGVGPKTAIGVLGTMPIKDLKTAIAMNDVLALSRAPGIGKKTAQRIAMELKDKISEELLVSSPETLASEVVFQASDAKNEALIALKSLGYTHIEASDAIKMVLQTYKTEALSANDMIRYALKAMSE